MGTTLGKICDKGKFTSFDGLGDVNLSDDFTGYLVDKGEKLGEMAKAFKIPLQQQHFIASMTFSGFHLGWGLWLYYVRNFALVIVLLVIIKMLFLIDSW